MLGMGVKLGLHSPKDEQKKSATGADKFLRGTCLGIVVYY
ncbi:hypothetical protein VTH8203_03727 [Vibrio thalassae]|uniref:Uncharacterized protein n=1 Tax=Vibrio thalassae TaxID=1243014 RepID=A0A240EPQ3_9VIBR|nr:hypothetical protein VTH8203_03727 [Vibrio thalassae]